MNNTDFRSRSTQEFILKQISQSLEMPRRHLDKLDATIEHPDPLEEMSYQAFQQGRLDSADTLAIAR